MKIERIIKDEYPWSIDIRITIEHEGDEKELNSFSTDYGNDLITEMVETSLVSGETRPFLYGLFRTLYGMLAI